MLYAVQATVTRTRTDGWESCRSLPTFYLDSGTQGIVSTDHARRIALDVVQSAAGEDATASVSVEPVPNG